MRSGLVALLAGEATISGIVGARIYVARAPQHAVLPYLIVTQMGSDEHKSLDGTGELRSVEFDIDCKADRSIESQALGDAVRAFIQDYSGVAGNETIEAVLLNNERTEYEEPTDGSDVGVYNTLLDLTVQYNPS